MPSAPNAEVHSRQFFDTSILVPAFLQDHPHHPPCVRLLNQAAPSSSFAAAHSLVELYSTLTRLPPPFRLAPTEALDAARTVLSKLTLIALSADEYLPVLENGGRLNVQGGTAYDLLIAACAEKAGIDILYTWNMRHYQLFGPGTRDKLRAPDQTA